MYRSAWSDVKTEVVKLDTYKNVLLVTIPRAHYDKWFEDGVEQAVLYLYEDNDETLL